MKPVSIALPLLTFISSVTAQATLIDLPLPGTQTHKEQNPLVQIIKLNKMMGPTEIGLVLSFQYCSPPNEYPDAVDDFGDILYIGKLNMVNFVLEETYENLSHKPNDSVESPGSAQIIETRHHLLGAGPTALLEMNTVAMN